ncbi:hypothetical protein [Flavobacterium sp. FlaQc-47]|uniref:hypothetical protein n=1 Tax=Flavobacterium sp. FlaQc-47 TaxID=3374180 RepID=UPI00375820A8
MYDVGEEYFLAIDEMSISNINEFWVYVSETVRFYVGGDYILAGKSEDVAFTPRIVNYGYKEKWEGKYKTLYKNHEKGAITEIKFEEKIRIL